MLENLVYFAIVIATFMAMEGVAWATHKYVMHGFLWSLHESHHRPRRGLFELNDLFAFYFALPSILFIWLGVNVSEPLLYVGIGMTAYGAMYFIFHDGIVHRRMGFRYRAGNPYMKRIIHAHWVHHAWNEKEGAVSFGFLYARPAAKLQDEQRRIKEMVANTDST
ncbi:MAG: sterol desaturase family protein [Gammaproteobacteria bacterium]